jgi:hypothetical protein
MKAIYALIVVLSFVLLLNVGELVCILLGV